VVGGIAFFGERIAMKRILSALSLPVLVLVAAVVAQTPAPAIIQVFGFPCDQTLTICPLGDFPSGLIESADGNFYGTTVAGGTGLNSQGTVFKLTPSGQLTVIYNFAEQSDGSLPNGAAPTSLVEGIDGFLYGTTLVDGGNGVGTVFKLSKTGTITLLHSFCNTIDCHDGANPSFLTQAIDGNFYGATGPNNPPTSVLFRMSPSGAFKVLHNFDPKTQPDGTGVFGMLQASDGNFYGTTVAGSQLKPFNSVFRLNPTTTQYTILHAFNSPNNNLPNVAASGLTLASDGKLYGLRVGSILYRLTPSGGYHEIGPLSQTQFSDGDLIQASDGNFWGDFFSVPGIVFSAALSGSVLRNLPLNSNVNGAQPSGIFQAADGKVYGVAFRNGAPTNGQPSNGTVWFIDAGLPAPSPTLVNFLPASGKAGSTVLLQGAHFVGTTEVKFAGVTASFKVLTANYIRATVPAGAITGSIAVTNAGGTVSSQKTFIVQ
jgi:uncharacterized repeat protein (TIGR03803 family)